MKPELIFIIPTAILLFVLGYFVGADSVELPKKEAVKVETKHDAEFEKLMSDMDKSIADLKLANEYFKGFNSGYKLGYWSGYYAGGKEIKEIMESKKTPLVNHPKK